MMSGFWSMGGYARYVWPCFAFAGAVLGWNLWSARRSLNAARLRSRRALEMAMTSSPATATATATATAGSKSR